MSETLPYDGLFNAVVRRLRTGNTIFGQNIKLAIRQLDDQAYTRLSLPYMLVYPTVTRVEGGRAATNDVESIINPRSITFLCQFNGRGSELDWAAGLDIEIAERQLIGRLVNWRPHPGFLPTSYSGMRIEAARAPDVKASYVFVFREELWVQPDLDADLCTALATPMLEPSIIVSLGDPCAPVPEPPHDPCEDPCEPCAPDPAWSVGWLTSKGDVS